MRFIQKFGDLRAGLRVSSNGLDVQRPKHVLYPMDWRFSRWNTYPTSRRRSVPGRATRTTPSTTVVEASDGVHALDEIAADANLDGYGAVLVGGSLHEGRYQREPHDNLTPEKLFDRRWALILLAVADQIEDVPVHAQWHDISLDVGPYREVPGNQTAPAAI